MEATDQSTSVVAKKHQWTSIEDSKLVECLLKISNSGKWRADNDTFKPSYLQQLEKMMHEKLPHCELRAQPHNDSRIKILKRQYYAISKMLSDSANGFGWNDSMKCVDVDQSVFDNWVKSHPTAKGLKNKPFPHYDELGIVFGKDRATRKGAIGFTDVVEEIDKELENHHDNVEFDPFTPLDELNSNASINHISTPSSTQAGTKTRKRSRSGDALVDLLSDIVKEFNNQQATTNDNIKKLVDCFQYKADGVARRMQVFEEIKKIEGLTNAQQVKVGCLLVNNQTETDYFFTLDEESKLEFLMQMLE